MTVRVPLWLVTILALVAFALGASMIRSCNGKPPEITGAELGKIGFTSPDEAKPKIEDLPKGAKPGAVFTGRIRPVARVPASVPAGLPALVAQPSPPGEGAPSEALAAETPPSDTQPQWPAPTDLGGSCDCQLARSGQTVFGRVFWTGELQGKDGGILFTRGPLLAQEVHLAVEAGTVPAPRLAFLPRRPRDWRLGISCGAGLGYDPIRQAPVVTAACLWGAQF